MPNRMSNQDSRDNRIQELVPDPRRWRMLALLGIAQFMLILDVTVVAIALPHIGAELELGRATLTWVVSAYTLMFGGLMLLGGRAADLFGARRLVLAGVVVFTTASLVTGLADSAAILIGGRIAQGVGAAMVSPAALSVVVTSFEGDERNRALGIWSALGGTGAAIGVLLGGVLTSGPGWAWVFYINVPVGLVVFVALSRLLPVLPTPGERTRLDVPGALLVTLATGTAIYALINAGDRGWLTPATLWPLLAAAALYAIFATWQRTAAAPLMDLGILARRPVAAGTFLILIATALMIAVFFLGSFYLQHHQGYGALRTGLLFLPVALATMLGANTAGRVIGQTGARLLALVGLGTAAIGMAVPAIWDGPVPMVTGVSVGAAGIGAIFVVASATALGQVEPQEAGLAAGIVSTFHEFGAALGAAVVSSIAAASIAATSIAVTSDSGFTRGFAFGAVTAAIAGVLAFVVIPGRPESD